MSSDRAWRSHSRWRERIGPVSATSMRPRDRRESRRRVSQRWSIDRSDWDGASDAAAEIYRWRPWPMIRRVCTSSFCIGRVEAGDFERSDYCRRPAGERWSEGSETRWIAVRWCESLASSDRCHRARHPACASSSPWPCARVRFPSSACRAGRPRHPDASFRSTARSYGALRRATSPASSNRPARRQSSSSDACRARWFSRPTGAVDCSLGRSDATDVRDRSICCSTYTPNAKELYTRRWSMACSTMPYGVCKRTRLMRIERERTSFICTHREHVSGEKCAFVSIHRPLVRAKESRTSVCASRCFWHRKQNCFWCSATKSLVYFSAPSTRSLIVLKIRSNIRVCLP